MQNMWISIALIVIVIIAGFIIGSRVSSPGAQRRAVYAALATLCVLSIWFFIFISFFPADWIVPFFTVACIVIPICIYVGVTRGALKPAKKKKQKQSKKYFEIPRAVVENIDTASKTESTTKEAASSQSKTKTKSQPTSAAASKTKASSAGTSEKPASTASKTKKETPTPEVKPSASTTPKKDEKPAESAVSSKPQLPPTTKATALAAAEATTKRQAPKPAEERPAKQQVIEETASETTTAKEDAATASAQAPNNAKESAEDRDVLAERTTEADKAILDELVKPFLPQESAPSPDEEAERELDLGAPRTSSDAASEDAAQTQARVEAEPTKDRAGESSSALPKGVHVTPVSPVSRAGLKDLQLSASDSKPAAAPATAPAPKPKPKSAQELFAEFSNKAHTVRSQGQYAVAALLFEKAAENAPNATKARDMYFEQLSCYVKADQITQAKALAAKLRQSSVLTRFERIKLEAVERMS